MFYSSRSFVSRAILLFILWLTPGVLKAQFPDSYLILDSLEIYFYTTGGDSSAVIKTIYENDEHGLARAYDDLYHYPLSWEQNMHGEYTRDVFGNMLKSEIFRMDQESQEWENASLSNFTYTPARQICTRSTYYWDASGNRLGQDSTYHEYDSFGGLALTETYSYGISIHQWMPQGKEAWERDADGRVLARENYIWGIDGTWNPADRKEYHYNEKGLDTLTIQYRWDHVNNEWSAMAEYYTIPTYSPEGLLTDALHKSLLISDSSWTVSNKEIYNHEWPGDTIAYEMWVWRNDDWLLFRSQKRILDEEGRYSYFEGYQLIEATGAWTGDSKFRHFFNDAGQETYFEYYRWDQETGDWSPSSRNISAYRETGEVLYVNEYFWDKDAGTWKHQQGTYYHYTTYEDLDAPQLMVQHDSVFRAKVVDYTCSQDAWVYLVPEGTGPEDDLEDLNMGKQLSSGKVEEQLSIEGDPEPGWYYLYAVNSNDLKSLAVRVWIEIPLAVFDEPVQNQLTVFPTLVDQVVSIQSDQPLLQVEVYDVNGTLLKRKGGAWYSTTMDLSDLKPGVYFLRCKGSQGNATTIVKK